MKRMDPKKQFSKWLARYGAIVWGIYLILTIVLMFYRPETAMPCVYLVLIVTINKAIDGVQYNDNSKTEKILLAGIERLRLNLNFKGLGISGGSTKATEEDTNDEEDSVIEEGENG